MDPSYFPLRWESTGDKWWYASPIDWAAANGLYDLVRELLRMDGNQLIQLTSLRRIRRLEAVWDDEEEFHGVANSRCEVAKKLLQECESKKGKNSLIGSGYGGWLLYTAASAGDEGFVQELLERDPLLVFGEGEYGVTDILYAAAKSKKLEVFRVVYDFAASPRFLAGKMEEPTGDMPSAFKKEVKNRALHAAARGGNLMALKELLGDGDDVLAYKDANGSTLLHAAAGKGQVEVVKHLVSSYDIISSTDNNGNTPLHIAAFRGQLSVVEALVVASKSTTLARNKAGNTFLHMAVSGFQTPGFRRLDRQIELMKQLASREVFNVEEIINAKNSEGRTALHMAIIGNVHSSLVELLMTVRYINMNICDDHGLTPLDYLRQQPQSSSSEMLMRQMISAGGMYCCHDYSMRKAIASQLRLQGICGSPGSSFKVSDAELFFHTGIGRASDFGVERIIPRHFPSASEISLCDSATGDSGTPRDKKPGMSTAAKHLKTMFNWPMLKQRKTESPKKHENLSESRKRCSGSEETLIPLRERYSISKPSSPAKNKRTLAVRSNISSPTNRKKFASGVAHGFFQDLPHINIPDRSTSSSFSKCSLSSRDSVDKGKGIALEDDIAGPSCYNQIDDDDTPNVMSKHSSMSKKLMNQILCFGAPNLSVRKSIGRQQMSHSRQASRAVEVTN